MFGTFFLLFSRYFPVIAQAELKTILKSSGQSQKEAAKNHH
jgi:molybdopterin-containing oxidoreductase family membrane subunit